MMRRTCCGKINKMSENIRFFLIDKDKMILNIIRYSNHRKPKYLKKKDYNMVINWYIKRCERNNIVLDDSFH